MLSRTDRADGMGDEPPILAGGTRAPDRREVSLRWLSGTFMTGITSISLMGIALFVALEGKEQLTSPAVALNATDPLLIIASLAKGEKQHRIRSSIITNREPDKLVMDVPTLINEGDQQIVRTRPFVHVSMPLASNYQDVEEYPKFNPLQIFSTTKPELNASFDSGAIYGAKVDSEIALKTYDYPYGDDSLRYAARMNLDEAEETVRTNGSILIGQDSQIAALHYVDPRRFGNAQTAIFDFTANIQNNARVVAENISVASYAPKNTKEIEFFEDVQTIRTAASLSDILTETGHQESQITKYVDILSQEIDVENLNAGTSIRLGIEQDELFTEIVRISIYEKNNHIITAALNDKGRYVIADEPIYSPNLAALLEDTPNQVPQVTDLPTTYDAIYRAGLYYGMTQDMIKQLVQLMAANVDFRAKIRPTDKLEAFFSVEDESSNANKDSDLLYISANFGDTTLSFYKFTHPDDGTIDFYNKDGRSGRQFLLRNPAPTGIFRSPFGIRRHPITGRTRMHSGVDWAAPRGTPILASGDGVVLEAGWHSGGYGRQTKIKHANGYVSSYSHQSKISNGVVPGARVKQGQIIGLIGSTGLSTGPHLHYELIVNGTKVDPLRVRLPDSKALKGDVLATFHQNRLKINTLLGIEDTTTLASN
ncbi:peptidoglycan DD-metalloendopeptidase family protein [Lentilitoribacter sp. EG35]|uniref:peptidoglycan DD-metalloendopeptidase family protein n=1 Tax=Lentilitoribacter sp. EG35 TaxID=3234192 RepID=UPI00345FCBA9